MEWSSEDISWLKANYPGLHRVSDNIIEGRLTFKMLHADDVNYIKPNEKLVEVKGQTGIYRCDTYRVRIEWKKFAFMPHVYEIGGRLEAVAKSKGKTMLDMHTNSGGNSLCVASPMVLMATFVEKFDLKRYIEEFLVPYLFAQTHYADTDVWLWGELSHDYWGHLEWLSQRSGIESADMLLTVGHIVDRIGVDATKKLLSVRCRRHHPCPCGSDKKTGRCHPDIVEGISRIRGALSRKAFSIEDLAR